MSEKIAIEDIRRLDIKPGETLVVTLADGVDQQAFARISDAIKAELPDGVKLLITSGAVKFGVVSADSTL